MAKYSKFDPRNKKQGRQEADWKSGWENISNKRMLNEVMYDDETDHDELNNQELRG
jgi:hypothetical protein